MTSWGFYLCKKGKIEIVIEVSFEIGCLDRERRGFWQGKRRNV